MYIYVCVCIYIDIPSTSTSHHSCYLRSVVRPPVVQPARRWFEPGPVTFPSAGLDSVCVLC